MIDTRNIQPGTNRQLHALLNKAGKISFKADLIHGYTDGRTEHSSAMLEHEALALIQALQTEVENQDDSCNKMRRKILAICHTLQWYKRNEAGELEMKDGRTVLDMARIDRFCTERGKYKKALQKHNLQELTTMVTVFEKL